MAKAKRKDQVTVGRVLVNHATGRTEVRKDALYSFVVPTFAGWTPRSEARDGDALKRK